MLKPKTISQLSNIVQKANLLNSPEDLVCYSYDATNRKFLPDAVVFPANTEEVSAILKLANRDQFPVIPRGAGSGFTGGTLAVHGGVVLVTSRLNRIIEIDTDNLRAVVEPGVICGAFQKAVEEVKQLSKRPSNEQLLEIYALFKQATTGEVSGKRPSMLDLRGRAKFDAWSQKKGLSQEEAKAQYISLVRHLQSE